MSRPPGSSFLQIEFVCLGLDNRVDRPGDAPARAPSALLAASLP